MPTGHTLHWIAGNLLFDLINRYQFSFLACMSGLSAGLPPSGLLLPALSFLSVADTVAGGRLGGRARVSLQSRDLLFQLCVLFIVFQQFLDCRFFTRIIQPLRFLPIHSACPAENSCTTDSTTPLSGAGSLCSSDRSSPSPWSPPGIPNWRHGMWSLRTSLY